MNMLSIAERNELIIRKFFSSVLKVLVQSTSLMTSTESKFDAVE